MSAIRELWDFSDPATSEQRFREAMTHTEDSAEREAFATQVARALGLQRRFDEGHAVLDGLSATADEVQVRLALERGRLFRSGGEPERSREPFLEAWKRAQEAGLDELAVDAAHMMGIIESGDEALAWNDKALALAERSEEPGAQAWLGSLYNNIGWTRHDMGQPERALSLFERALVWREARDNIKSTLIARWCVARCMRTLGRLDEALAIQETLVSAWFDAGGESGYVFEELGELKVLLGRAGEAQPHFARAYAVLSKDAWLMDNEAERMARLKRLAEGGDTA